MMSMVRLAMFLVFAFGINASNGGEDSEAMAAAKGAGTAFHEALKTGDRAKALELLAPDAVIIENGVIQTRDDYEAHHLADDIAFAHSVALGRVLTAARVEGDMVSLTSALRATGEFRGRPVNSIGAELMVLIKIGSEWRISAVHWSSRTAGENE